jgi:hypothetical protein
MADRNAGNGKTVAISDLGITGTAAANYTLTGAAGLTVNITPKSLTAIYTGADKIYDGTVGATIVGSSSDILAIDAGTVLIQSTGTFTGVGAKNVGTAKAVAVAGGFLAGAQRDNYTLVNATGGTTAGITPRSLTASYTSGLSKVYDGSTDAPASGRLNNLVAGDAVTLTQTAAFSGAGARNVGNGKAIDITGLAVGGDDAGNYTLLTVSASTVGNITPKPITIGGLSNVVATDRVYDSTRQVDVTVPAGVTLVPNSSDIVAGDQVTIGVPGSGVTTGTMANKNVGSGKAVTVDGLSLTGTDGSNYTIAGTAGITVNITPKALTANYVGNNKVYDGSTAATVHGSSNDILAGDGVTVSGTGVFTGAGARNAGNAKDIDVLAGHLSGGDAGNYALTNVTGTATADITPKSVTVVYVGGTKVYDGTALAPVTAGNTGFITGDSVSLSETAVFNGAGARNVGANKAVSISGITLSGNDAGNYSLTSGTATTTASITPKPLRIDGLTGVAAIDRAYNGSNVVDVTVSSSGPISANQSDLIAGDIVTVTAPAAGSTTGTMADKRVGSDKPVAVLGLSLGGADAGNYSITATSGVTVNITPKTLTANYSGVAKVYDGNAIATVIGSSADVVAGDLVTITGSGLFSGAGGKNAGVGKAIDVLSASLASADAANYTLLNPTGAASGTITPKTVTANYTGGAKVYDGTADAPVVGSAIGFINGDSVGLTQTALFTGTGAKNVGNGKSVSVSGIALDGADAGNYALAGTATTTTANITPKPLRIDGLTGVSATDRAYDGTTQVAVSVTSSGPIAVNQTDLVAGDVVTVTAPAAGNTTGTMADKNVGRDKTVVVAGLTLGGADAGNYMVAGSAGVTVNITPRSLTAIYTGMDKVYDGSPSATVSGTSGDIVVGDLVSVGGSGLFTGVGAKNVGVAKAISVTAGSLSGVDAANYALLNATGGTSASITPKAITATYLGVAKVYDGTTAATVTASTVDLVAGDVVSFSQTAQFTGAAGRNVGNGKTVAVSGITLQGSDAANYTLLADTATTTASITPRPLNVTGLTGISAVDRVYDGSRNVQINTSGSLGAAAGDVLAGDDVSVGLPAGGVNAGLMADKSAGNGKAVVVAGLTLTGADATNYQITGTAGVTVNIAPRPVALLGVSAVDRVYDGTSSVAINSAGGSISGGLAGDDLQLLSAGVTGSMADKHAGLGKAVAVTGLALGGSDAANYVVANAGNMSVNIAPRTLVATVTAADKVYDGSTGATVTLRDDRIAGDALTLASASATFNSKDAGAGKAVTVTGIATSGADAADYVLANAGASTTATITRAPATVTAGTLNKVYGESVNLTGTEFTTLGLVAGESIGLVSLTSAGTVATASVAGGPYAIAASDASGGSFNPSNYSLSYVGGQLRVTPRPVTVAADSKVRFVDEDQSLITFGGSSSVGGLVGGDKLSVTVTPPAGSATAPGGSVYELAPSGVNFAPGDASNYAVSYANGLLVILPKPPRLGDVDTSTGNSGGNVTYLLEVTPAEAEGARSELERTTAVVRQSRLVAVAEPALPDPNLTADVLAAELAEVLAGDGRHIRLPALQRQPLISFDPKLRRLILGTESAPTP